MRRRRVLASISTLAPGIVTTGCLDATGGGEQSALDVALEAEVLRSFDDEHPARVRLRFANQSDELLLLSPGAMRGFAGPITAIRGRRRDDDRELLLFYRGRDVTAYARCGGRDQSPIPDDPVDGCWRPPCSDGIEIISSHGPLELGAGEEITGEYTVLDGFDDGCLLPGTYDFEDSTAIGPAIETSDTVEHESEPGTLERRLSVLIEDDSSVSVSADATVTPADDSPSDDPAKTPESAPR